MDRTEGTGPEDARQTNGGARGRSLGDLFTDLSRGAARLVSQELELARTEMTRKVSRTSRDSLQIAIGGAVVYAGFLSLLVAAVAGLSIYMHLAFAASLVGVVVSGTGLLVVRAGRRKLREEDPVPRKTIEALKGESEWNKQRMM